MSKATLKKGVTYTILLSYMHMLGYQAAWADRGDDPRHFVIKVKSIDNQDDPYGDPTLKLSFKEKNALGQVTTTLFSSSHPESHNPSTPWTDKKGQTLGVKWTLEGLGTLKADWSGKVTLKGKNLATERAQPSYSIKTSGLLKLIDVQLSSLKAKASSVLIQGQTALKTFRFKRSASEAFQGCMIASQSSLTTKTLDLDGDLINLGSLHLQPEAHVDLHGHDLSNFHTLHHSTATLEAIGAFYNQKRMTGDTLGISARTFYNSGDMQAQQATLLLSHQGLNQGTLQAPHLKVTSLGSWENQGTLTANTMTLKALDLHNTGTLQGTTLHVQAYKNLHMDGHIQASTLHLLSPTFQGGASITADTAHLEIKQGLFTRDLLTKHKLSLKVEEAFKHEGSLVSDQALHLDLGSTGHIHNTGHLKGSSVDITGTGTIKNEGTLEGDKTLTISVKTLENRHLVTSQGHLHLKEGQVTNHDTWKASSMTLGSQAHLYHQSQHPAPRAFVVEKDLLCEPGSQFHNDSHALIGGTLQGTLTKLFNKGVVDAKSVDLSVTHLTNPGLFLAQGKLRVSEGTSQGTLQGGLSLDVQKTFLNRGQADLVHLTGQGAWINGGGLTFSGDATNPSTLTLRTFDNGGTLADGTKVKGKMSFQTLLGGQSLASFKNHEASEITGEVLKFSGSCESLNEGMMTLKRFETSFGKMVNLGHLKADALTAMERVVNALEAEMHVQQAAFNKEFLNEGDAHIETLRVYDMINRGLCQAKLVTLGYFGKKLVNEGRLTMDDLTLCEGQLLNESSGKLFIKHQALLRPWLKGKEKKQAEVSVVNRGLMETESLTSQDASQTTVTNAERGTLRIGKTGTFHTLHQVGTLQASEGTLSVGKDFINTGKTVVKTFHKTSPGFENKGELIAKSLKLQGKITNSGQLSALEEAHLDLQGHTLTNDLKGKLCLVTLQLLNNSVLKVDNKGILQLLKTKLTPLVYTGTILNGTQGQLSIEESELNLDSFENHGQASFASGTYNVKTTRLKPTSVFTAKERMNYWYQDFENEGLFETEVGMRFQVGDYLKKLGRFNIKGLFLVTLVGDQNVVDFYNKATVTCQGPIIFKADRFETQAGSELSFPHTLILTVNRFLNQGVLKLKGLTVTTDSFANEGDTRLADIETDEAISVTTQTFSSQKGSMLAKDGNLSLTVTQGDARIGDRVYDPTQQFYRSNGAMLASGKELTLKVPQGSLFNQHGTLASKGQMCLMTKDTLRNTAGVFWSQTGFSIEAHVLELIREACRSSQHQTGTHTYTEDTGWGTVTVSYPIMTTNHYDTSDAAVLMCDNTYGSGDVTLAVDQLNIVGSQLLAAGWLRDRHGSILHSPQDTDADKDIPGFWRAFRKEQPFPASYHIASSLANNFSLVKGRQGIDLSAEHIRVTGGVKGFNVKLNAKLFEAETTSHQPRRAPSKKPVFINLTEAFQQFAARGGLFTDGGEQAYTRSQPRYTTRLPQPQATAAPSRVYSHQAPLSGQTPVISLDQNAFNFILTYMASQHINLKGFQGNLYDRLHQNALDLKKSVITQKDVEQAIEALIIYQVRHVCDTDVAMARSRVSVLDPVLAVPASAQDTIPNHAGLGGGKTLHTNAEDIDLIGAHKEADDLYLHATNEFKSRAQKKGTYSTQGDTLRYDEQVTSRTTNKGRQKAHVMGEKRYHVTGTDNIAGPQGGTYGSTQGDAISGADYTHHTKTTHEHKDGGFFGTSSHTTTFQEGQDVVNNTYVQEGPFTYHAGDQATALFEGVHLFLNAEGVITGGHLEVKPGVSTQRTSVSSDKQGAFYSKSSHSEQRTASFLPSWIQFMKADLHLKTETANINGTHMKGGHVIDHTKHCHVGMAKETNTSTSHTDHTRATGYADQTVDRGQEVGCPSVVDLESWKTPEAQTGAQETLVFEGVQGHIDDLTTKKDVSTPAASLKSWETVSGSSGGFKAPILEGKIEDPLVNSVQGFQQADHDADKAAAGIDVAGEVASAALLAARMAAGDPTAWIDLVSRYINVSFEISHSRSHTQTRQEVPTHLTFNTLTLDNEYTYVQGFIKAKKLTIRTKKFTTTPLVNESRSEQSHQSASFSPADKSFSYQESSSSRYEKNHTLSGIEADEFFLECDDVVLSGMQIRARVIDGIIRHSLTLESVLNVLREETQGASFSSSGDIRLEDRTRVREKVDELVRMVGEEQFYLKVGALLLTRSALLGLEKQTTPANTLQDPAGKAYYVRPLPMLDNDCGFYGLLAGRVLGRPRAEAAEKLLQAATDPAVRALIAPEILEGLIEGSHNLLPQADVMATLWQGDETAQAQVIAWANTQEVYEAFITQYVAKAGVMLSYLLNDGAGQARTSTMDAIAHLYGFGLEIYHISPTGQLELKHTYGVQKGIEPVRLVHVKTAGSAVLNHFERLETDPEQIAAAQRRDEVIQERDETSGYVFNAPIGKTKKLYQNFVMLDEILSAKEEVYASAMAEGLSEDEALKAAQEMEDVLNQPEVQEALGVIHEAAQEIREELKKEPSQSKASQPKAQSETKKTSANKDTTKPASAPEVNWEAFDLKNLPAYKPEVRKSSTSTPTQEQADLSARGKMYDKLARATECLKQEAQKHPHLMKALGHVIEAAETLTRAYVYVEAAAAGGTAGFAMGGPIGAGIGIGVAVTGVYGTEKAMVSAFEAGVEAVAHDA